MGAWLDALYLISILLEVTVLSYLEYKTWGGFYTPLNFLMLPYIAVLLITIMLAGNALDFVEFYYPSIFIWNVGLLLFAIPSYVIGILLHGRKLTIKCHEPDEKIPQQLLVIVFVMSLLFIWHIKSSIGSSAEALGSEEFGEEFSGGGLWGHLRIMSLPLLMICIYYVSKKNRWLWPVIIVFLLVGALNQVKGWVIIPVLAAMAMRVCYGKTRLSLKLLTYIVLGSFLVFFLSYALSILVVQERGVSDEFMEFIFKHFFHYLTSGTLGWSMDVQLGIPDDGGDFENIIAQFVNLFKSLAGDRELVAPINPLFYNTGTTLTNVRTLFGTLYINSNWIVFAIYTLFLSTCMYFMKVLVMCRNNIYISTVYFFFCAMLFMGWFDFYFSGMIVLEFPVMVIAFWVLGKVVCKKNIAEDEICRDTN